jgi:hypothetical protein
MRKVFKQSILAVPIAMALFVCESITAYAAIPIVQDETPVMPQQITAVTNQYNMIPASIRDAYEERGNQIYFFEKIPKISNLLGIYTGNDGNQAKIILTNRDYGGAEAVTHEIGHFFDDLLQPDNNATVQVITYLGIPFMISSGGKRYYSDDEEFKKIYAVEAQSSNVSAYEKMDVNEYFAGAFGVYCTDPKGLSSSAPHTYAVIDTLVKQFSAQHPAKAETLQATMMPARIDAQTNGLTSSGIFKNSTFPQDSGTMKFQGQTANGTSSATVETKEDGTTTVTSTVRNADGSVTTTTKTSSPYGIFVNVTTTY